jgi:CBS domain-containing protein
MPYEVRQLLKDIGQPVVATPDEPIRIALNRMLHHSFSQLPVVKGDGQQRHFYFITHESILLALHNFGSKIEESGLRVDDALVKVPNVYHETDDLFELLVGMREMNAVLIVDDDRNLTHIVTNYDTSRYFRQWAEDIMQVRDVEHGLRRIINSAFKRPDGEIDEQARRSAVEEITSSNRALRKKFGLALKNYIAQQGETAAVPLDETRADDAFKYMLNRAEKSKEFTELALGEYIQLFFTDGCWGRCRDVIKLKEEEVRHMLEGVRDTRNDLAHFREEEITAQKRLQLKTCADWLGEREKLIIAVFECTVHKKAD